MRRFFVVAVSFMLFSVIVSASETAVFIRGTRALGMGGSFTAISDDQNAFFFNPAGLTQRQGGQFTLFELPVTITEDALKFYQFYQDNEDKMSDFEELDPTEKADLVSEINNTVTRYKTRVRLGFPNVSYLSGPGFISWGLGVFDQADIGFQIKQGIIIPNIDFWGNLDVVAALPLAHRFDSVPYIPGKMSVGITPKLINRGKIAEYNKSILEFSDFSPLIQMGQGYGFDLGTLYQPNERWNAADTVNDFGGTE